MVGRPEWSSASEEYRYGLRDLTFNSKPIINNLTVFAQDHIQLAPALARVLTDHLVTCPLEYKLPALYLIDSIVKNIGEPYVGLLSALLPTAFPEAYRQLRDDRVRRDFGRTLETWWNVLSPDLIRSIQQRSFGTAPAPIALGPRRMEALPAMRDQRAVRPHLVGPPGVRPDYLPVPGRHLQFIPYTPTYPLSDIILRILADLRTAMLVPPERYNEKYVADIMYRLEYECQSDPSLFRALDERARISDKMPLIDLIDSLIAFSTSTKANSLKRSSDPTPPASQSKHMPTRSPPTSSSVTPVNLPDVSPLLASLSSLPLSFNFNLPTVINVRPVYEEIIKNRPDAHNALYANLPRQCTNCGFRFPDTPEGQKKLDAHLDAHFRRNIRLKDKGKKVLARLWMSNEQDWIKNVESAESEKPVALFTSSSSKAKPVAEKADDRVNMIMAGSDHADRVCDLCQEPIGIVWDDESDEWMYKDAIYAGEGEDKQIIHASCSGK